jgi:hypothetical protein
MGSRLRSAFFFVQLNRARKCVKLFRSIFLLGHSSYQSSPSRNPEARPCERMPCTGPFRPTNGAHLGLRVRARDVRQWMGPAARQHRGVAPMMFD